MGNQGSRRKPRTFKWRHKKGDDAGHGSDTEDLENITPESYNKLLAWMVEMAENDEADLASPEYIEHITSSCAAKQHTHSEYSCPPTRQHSLDTHLDVPRQNSLDSSCGSRYSRSSRSREDLLHPKTRFRSKLSRQQTVDYSDDGDVPTDISTGSSFDHDNDYDIVNPDTVLINNYSETSFSRPPGFRPQLRKNQSCTTYGPNIASSLGDLLNVQSRKKSKSLMTMRKMMSETRNDDEITPITEETVVKLLDNNLLDGNMADILYSVEALWPKVPKQ